MSVAAKRRRWFAAVLVATALLVPIGPIEASAAPGGQLGIDSVAISVLDVSPTSLPMTATPKPLAVTLELVNRSTQQLTGVTIEAQRGEPQTTQAQLDAALAHVSAPTGHVVTIDPVHPVKVDLAPGSAQEVVFRSTTSTQFDDRLCNCATRDRPWMYPLYFSAHVAGPGGVDQRLGLANTFVSAFAVAPAPVRVSWVWPLVDQPHLLSDIAVGTGGPVFADDVLAASVGPGGRLDRALGVLEAVAQSTVPVPVTVLIDPELLVELQIMSTGKPGHPEQSNYQTLTAPNHYAPGVGKDAAAAWLSRLRALLDADPHLDVELTSYADPDVESLHAAHLNWQTQLPADLQGQLEQALGGHATAATLAWPATGILSRGTLNTLVDEGVSTVLVNARTVTPRPAPDAVRPGLARLSSSGRDVAAGLLDAGLQRYVQDAIASDTSGNAAVPRLMSQLAIRAVQEPDVEHPVVLTPPRWVDPSIDDAARLIVATSQTPFTRPIALADAVGGDLLPNGRSRLARVTAAARPLPAVNVQAATQVTDDLPLLTGLLTPVRPATIDPRASQLLAALPLEAQRATASAWGRPGNSDGGESFANDLTTQLGSLTSKVSIVRPSSGSYSYTLASDNAKLPITVRNDLPFPVRVMVQVQTVNDAPGFRATPRTQVVEAHQKATLHLSTNIGRTGRIPITAALYTPDGQHQVGDAVNMTVRSTALGVIGVIIMVVSGTVLALALLIRFGRRLRGRWSRNEVDRARWDPDAATPMEASPAGPEPAGTATAQPVAPAERSP